MALCLDTWREGKHRPKWYIHREQCVSAGQDEKQLTCEWHSITGAFLCNSIVFMLGRHFAVLCSPRTPSRASESRDFTWPSAVMYQLFIVDCLFFLGLVPSYMQSFFLGSVTHSHSLKIFHGKTRSKQFISFRLQVVLSSSIHFAMACLFHLNCNYLFVQCFQPL